MHYVYILECADGTLYVGYTTDVQKRLKEHNDSKRGAKYTSGRRPVTLRYKQRFKTVNKALAREYAIKQLTRREKLLLIE